MTRRISVLAKRATLAALGILFLAPLAVEAQGGDGFLFRQPRVTLKFESGYVFQRARGELFDDAIQNFTLGRRDFDSPYVGGEVAVRVGERWDVAFSVGFQESSASSETREFIGSDGLPIVQVTSLRLVPATVSGKYYLRDRGRAIGELAWIPNAFSPFVGMGVGVVAYQFEQVGEFVDYQTLIIDYNQLRTDGQAFLARASAGVNVSLGKQFLFTAEGRYGFARGGVSGNYDLLYNKMNLGGLQLVGGLAVRF